MDGHLGCFLILVTVKIASADVGVQESFQDLDFNSFEKIPRSGIIGSHSRSIKKSWKNPCFPKWVSVQFNSFAQSCWLFVTLWTTACQASPSITNSWSLLKLMSTDGDTIQPSHPLLSPSSLTFNLSQHQGLFQWVSSPHQVAKVLELQLQHQSFQWIFRTDFL